MVTLWRKDKIPYGTYFAYENMKYIFPDALISINKNSPVTFNTTYALTGTDNNTRRKAYIIIASRVVPDKSEINALMNFVGEGNQLFISSFHMGDSLLAYLRVTEVMFHPPPGGFEFVELHNISPTVALDLSGVKFTQPERYRFAPNINIIRLTFSKRSLISPQV